MFSDAEITIVCPGAMAKDLATHLKLPYPFPQSYVGQEFMDNEMGPSKLKIRLVATEHFLEAFHTKNVMNVNVQTRKGDGGNRVRIKGTFTIVTRFGNESLNAKQAVEQHLEQETRRYSGLQTHDGEAAPGGDLTGNKLLLYLNKTKDERDRKRAREEEKGGKGGKGRGKGKKGKKGNDGK